MKRRLKQIFILFLCALLFFETPLITIQADETIETNENTTSENEPSSGSETTEISYNITYHFNGASYNDSTNDVELNYIENENGIVIATLLSPNALTYEKHDFDGWYTTEDFTSEKLGNTLELTSDIDVYAKWNSYNNVTYHFNGASYNGSSDDLTIKVYENELNLITANNLTYSQHDFAGWYTSENFSTEKLGDTLEVTNDVDVYAKWNAYNNVTYHFNGATYNGSSDNLTIKVYENNNITLIEKSMLSYDGMRFYGWFLSSNFTGNALSGSYKPTENTYFYAKWGIQEYVKLTFYPNDNSDLESYESESLPCGGTETFPYVEKAGYKLVGWFKNPDFENDYQNTGVDTTNYGTGAFTIPEEATTYYAKWEEDPDANVITISLATNITIDYIQWNTTNNKPYFYVNEGTNFYSKLTTPIVNGYDFKGWYTNKECTNALKESDCTTTQTIYAKLEESKTTITFSIPSGVQIVENGVPTTKSTYTISVLNNTPIEFPIPYKQYYEYKGWKLVGTDETYTSGYIATMGNNVTFEPIFVDARTDGLLFCLETRTVHYANVKDNDSRCPFCGHTTYEILYCATQTKKIDTITGCINNYYGQPHHWSSVKYNTNCDNPSANCSLTLQEATIQVFPDSIVSFEYSCSGDFSHNFTTINGDSVCSLCGMKYSVWLKAYNEQNPTSATEVANPQYKAQWPEKSGSNTYTTSKSGVPYGGNSRLVAGGYTSACWYCSYRYSGGPSSYHAWNAQCNTCGSRSGVLIYQSSVPSNNYSHYNCPSCGGLLQGAGLGTHTCRVTKYKTYTITFNQNTTYPKNSRNQSPSSSNGGSSKSTITWGSSNRTPSINSWVGYTTDKWMYSHQVIMHNQTYYLNVNQSYSKLGNNGDNLVFYARHIPYKYTITFNFNRPETASSMIKVGNNILSNTIASTSAKVNFDDYLTSAINTTDSTMDGKYLSVPTMEGWIFKGWSTNANGTGTLVTSETRLTESNLKSIFGNVPTNGTTLNLYAVWQPVNAQLIFNANNDEKANEYGTAKIIGSMASINDTYDSGAIIPTISYRRVYTTYYNKEVDYVFAGWLLGSVSNSEPSGKASTTINLASVNKNGTPITNKVTYLNVTDTTASSFNSYMNGSITLGQSTQGTYIKNRLQARYGTLTNDTRTYDGTNINNTRWDYGFVVTRAKATNKSIRFNYTIGTPYVTFYDGDNNMYRNIPNGAYVSFDANASYSGYNATANYGGTTYVDLYATWLAYNTRPQAFFRFAVKEFNKDGTFTGNLVDYKDDSFYGNKTSGTPTYNDVNSSSTTVYDDAYVYLHAAYYDPEEMKKGADEYQFSVDGGNTWYLLQPGIDNKYISVVATTYTAEGIKTDTISTTNGFTSNEISGPSSGYVYKVNFKTNEDGSNRTILLRYRAKDSIKYAYYYANVDDYENGVLSEAQKVLWSTGYYESDVTKYDSATFEGQTLKRYKGDTNTAGTLTKKSGEISTNSNENGSWATKTITVKKGNSIPEIGLNGSNLQKDYYSSLNIAMPMYDYYTNVNNNTETYNYQKGNIYLLVSEEEENFVNSDTTLSGSFKDKIITARGLSKYKNNIYLIRETENENYISTNNTLSYNSQTLKTDNSGTKTYVTGSQYTTYVPGDETLGFLDTSVDKDNKGFGLYFISIIDKDSMTDILYNSSDTVTSQAENTTGMANQLGKELYANTKTIPNGAVYTYKNTSLKTNDSTVGVKGHIFTDYESMIKFIYQRVGAEFPEVSDLYNGQYIIFYAVCDNTWNNMSPQKWSSICVTPFETQPRLSVIDAYVSNIEDPSVEIDTPVSLWLNTSNNPKYRLSGYTNIFTFSGITAYRGSKLTSSTRIRYNVLNERATQSNTNYMALTTNDEKSPIVYKIHTGYDINFNIETLGADFVEMSLVQKDTLKPLTMVIEHDSKAQYDKLYASDSTKKEQYLLSYTQREKNVNSFVYSNVPHEKTGVSYGYKLTLTKKLITKPNKILQRTIILGEQSIQDSSMIYIEDSVYNDVGIDLID